MGGGGVVAVAGSVEWWGCGKIFSFSFQWDRWLGEWLNFINGAFPLLLEFFLGGL